VREYREADQDDSELMDKENQLTVAFSGHGVMADGESYLWPSDTDFENKNSVLSRDWVFERLEKCAARQKIFIVDACRDEVAFGGTKALGGAKTLEDPIGAETHGFVLIASCDREQSSWKTKILNTAFSRIFSLRGLPVPRATKTTTSASWIFSNTRAGRRKSTYSANSTESRSRLSAKAAK